MPAPTSPGFGPRRPGVRRGAPDRGPVIVLTAGSVRVLAPAPVRSFVLISRAGVGTPDPAASGVGARVRFSLTHMPDPAAPGVSPGREIAG